MDTQKKQLEEYSLFLEEPYEDFASLKDAMEEILSDNNIYSPELVPEDLFRHVFLPFFKDLYNGNVKEEEHNKKYSLLNKWLGLAKTPSKRVRVVDNRNNVIFVVPPIAGNSSINTKAFENVDFENLGKIYNNTNFLPDERTNIINGTLYSIPDFIREDEMKKYNKEWEAIFRRYELIEEQEQKVKEDIVNKEIKEHKSKGYDLDFD